MIEQLTPTEQGDLLAAMRRGWAICCDVEWYATHVMDSLYPDWGSWEHGDVPPSHGGAPTLVELLRLLPEVERSLIRSDPARWASAFTGEPAPIR